MHQLIINQCGHAAGSLAELVPWCFSHYGLIRSKEYENSTERRRKTFIFKIRNHKKSKHDACVQNRILGVMIISLCLSNVGPTSLGTSMSQTRPQNK